MNPEIIVVGSSNIDMVVNAEHLPSAGETILGGKFFMNPGGKGANQAITVARLGSRVRFITKMGNDIFCMQAIQLFEEEGIDPTYISKDPLNPTGVALITVDANAENCIVVASGANANLLPADIARAEKDMAGAEIILVQLEVPIETVEYVADLAAARGIKLVLNPAPVCALSARLLQHVYILTPNRKEAEMLSGIPVQSIEDAERAAAVISSKGVSIVIVTLGAEGVLVLDNGVYTRVPAVAVQAVDTTAAGDVFNGALVVALSEGKGIINAVEFACKAAAIAVTRLGAHASIPYRREVDGPDAVRSKAKD